MYLRVSQTDKQSFSNSLHDRDVGCMDKRFESVITSPYKYSLPYMLK